MSLSSQPKHKTITDRKTILTFGRYKGYSVEDILEVDPQYLLFCQNKIDWFDLDHKILDEIEKPDLRDNPIDMWDVCHDHD